MAEEAATPNAKGAFSKVASFTGFAFTSLSTSFFIAAVTASTMGGGLAAAATLTASSGPIDAISSIYGEAGREVMGMFQSAPDIKIA